MTLDLYLRQMMSNAEAIRYLVATVGDEQAKWKPDAESWSVLEVVCHLYETENADFRVRLDHILHKQGITPPEIFPDKWVIERAYNDRDLAISLQNFLDERQKSIEWLGTLNDPDWQLTASWRTIRAGDMFSAWVAHDILHIRQLSELQYAWLQKQVSPYQVEYAGEW